MCGAAERRNRKPGTRWGSCSGLPYICAICRYDDSHGHHCHQHFAKSDHTASTPPTGWDDIYCDTDGWISSRRIDQAWQESDSHDVFRKRFGMLEDAIEEWRAHGCTHEDMEYCSEWISNWAGVAHFRSLIAQMGGTDRFQTLAQMFPDGNGGIFPARMASSALSDLDIFDAEYPRYREDVAQLHRASLVNVDTHIVVHEQTVDLSSLRSRSLSWGSWELDRHGFHMVNHEGASFRSNDFTQCIWGPAVPMDYAELCMWECGPKGALYDNVTGQSITIYDPIGISDDELANIAHTGSSQEQHFVVTFEPAPGCLEYYPAQRLRKLLEASVVTGNPIIWC